jgi:hypothetical protein
MPLFIYAALLSLNTLESAHAWYVWVKRFDSGNSLLTLNYFNSKCLTLDLSIVNDHKDIEWNTSITYDSLEL